MFTVEQTPLNFRRQMNKVRNYIRSGVIDEKFAITLEFIRDPENILNIVKHFEEPSNSEYRDITMKLRNKYNLPVQDTYYNIMQHSERMNSKLSKQSQVDTRNKTPGEHTIYVVIEMSDGVWKPFTTCIKSFSDLGQETIEFPIKIQDLSLHTVIGFSIYDMSKSENNGLIASTTLNLYDSKRRLRQGVYDLFLWKDKDIDLSFKCTTPGLPPDNFYTEKINALLQKIGNKAPFDLMTQKGIKRQLHQFYLDSKSAFLEISLPFFEHQVMYYQSTYRSAKEDYTIPSYLKDKEIEYENKIKRSIGVSNLIDDRKIDFSYYNDLTDRDTSNKVLNDKGSEI